MPQPSNSRSFSGVCPESPKICTCNASGSKRTSGSCLGRLDEHGCIGCYQAFKIAIGRRTQKLWVDQYEYHDLNVIVLFGLSGKKKMSSAKNLGCGLSCASSKLCDLSHLAVGQKQETFVDMVLRLVCDRSGHWSHLPLTFSFKLCFLLPFSFQCLSLKFAFCFAFGFPLQLLLSKL